MGDRNTGSVGDAKPEPNSGKGTGPPDLRPEDSDFPSAQSKPKYTPMTAEQESGYLEKAKSSVPTGLYGVSTDRRLQEATALFQRLDRAGKGAISDDDIATAISNKNMHNRDLQWLLALREHKEQIKKLYPQDSRPDITRRDFSIFMDLLANQKSGTRFVSASTTGNTGELSPSQKSELINKFDNSMHFFSSLDHTRVDERLWGESQNPLDAVHPDAIKQTKLGSCFLSATLRAMAASDPAQIASMIQNNHDGTYTVRFPGAPGEPIRVSAPSRAELALANEGSAYGSWPAVLIKAYGQYRQANMWRRMTYGVSTSSFDGDGAEGGHARDAFTLLTGRKGEEIEVERDGREAILQKLTQAFKDGKNSPLVASSLPGKSDMELTPDGYYRRHAYTVTGFDPDGPGGGTIKLRNPWATVNKDEELSLNTFMQNFRALSYPVEKGESTCTFSAEQRNAAAWGEVAVPFALGFGVGMHTMKALWYTSLRTSSIMGIGMSAELATMIGGFTVNSMLSPAEYLINKYESNCISSKYGSLKSRIRPGLSDLSRRKF